MLSFVLAHIEREREREIEALHIDSLAMTITGGPWLVYRHNTVTLDI